jgi:hypothetical protein
MIPIDPLTATIGVLAWLAFRKQAGSNYGQMTPEREEVFQNAMKFLKDPNRMQTLAEEFQKEGLKFQAMLLRKRAEWRSRTPDVQEQHNEIFAKAMASENIKAILGVANAFEEMTATLKAKQLREHATEVHQNVLKKKADERNAKQAEENGKKNGAVTTIVAEAEVVQTNKPEEATGT